MTEVVSGTRRAGAGCNLPIKKRVCGLGGHGEAKRCFVLGSWTGRGCPAGLGGSSIEAKETGIGRGAFVLAGKNPILRRLWAAAENDGGGKKRNRKEGGNQVWGLKKNVGRGAVVEKKRKNESFLAGRWPDARRVVGNKRELKLI